MGDENQDFKVVDRRASSGSAPTPEAKAGDGFVMKEKPADEGDAAQPAQVDFSALCLSLATGALINLGLTPDPATQKRVKNLEMARHNIEILALLRDKTKGNLTPDEAALLENLLTEVRLRFVEASR